MFLVLTLVITMQGTNIEPVLALFNGKGNSQVSIFDSKEYGDISWGPQEYEIDNHECIYIHDVNMETLDDYINRIVKFDSMGNFLYVITPRSVPIFDRVWYGPMAIDPKTNDLLVLGSKWDAKTGNANQVPKTYAFRFSESSKFIEAIEIETTSPADFLLYDYEGKFYSKYIDGGTEFDRNITLVREIPKQLKDQQGYSQWSEWITVSTAGEYTPNDASAGKFLAAIKNVKTDKKIRFVFYNQPYYSASSRIEGCDCNGNLFLAGIRGNFLRINPTTKKVAFVNIYSLGVPKSVGDVRHATMISPNGCLYKSLLLRNEKKELEYQIYRISSEMFAEIECDSIIEEIK